MSPVKLDLLAILVGIMATVFTQLFIIPTPYIQAFLSGAYSTRTDAVVTFVHALLNIGPMLISLMGFGDLMSRIRPILR